MAVAARLDLILLDAPKQTIAVVVKVRRRVPGRTYRRAGGGERGRQ